MKTRYITVALASLLIGLSSFDVKRVETNTAEMQKEDVEVTTTNKKEANMKFELVKLPYAPDALEPVISATTIGLHHGKHLQTYVNNLNKLIEGTEFANMELVDIVKKSEGGIFNNAGQTLNHNLYFTQFAPNKGGEPTGDLLKAIEAKWGSFAEFKKQFEADATALFGAGWAWLATDKDGNLSINKYSNAGNPVVDGLTPLFGADVWEHAYYVDFENRRAEHLGKIWDITNWDEVAKRYANR
ncbi:hypothetical protein IX332_000803 [Porphyromonas levii]|nr:hypothetical protein [Porphyromonas levii]MBR8713549.1 hypothetical protein [Porphyromonas levii]MBR8715583.1 hypothetical protein [Porphyromonas levii]MBR8728108.1 hypothetical protein [Porphyromonas levii]MBR8729483.1 hypothetical protein [Porphyromonas levii]